MKKHELINLFISNHNTIVDYIDKLDEHEFNYSNNEKWTAGQQLQHILLTLQPLSKALSSKEVISEKFEEVNRLTWNYETVLKSYLKTSRKAPNQFLPKGNILPDQKGEINSEIQKNLERIEDLWKSYSEEDLDKLSLPHPLLGMLTIREMFYLMSYHPLHHLEQIKSSIQEK